MLLNRSLIVLIVLSTSATCSFLLHILTLIDPHSGCSSYFLMDSNSRSASTCVTIKSLELYS